eukprot:Gregarina_sp_Poly_1__9716@NODE_617_length_7122_cov_220_571368_g473_i0_p6_GENE_NODE_617_length_7122_cov_220_571368_g473_i0NODE_617_length_7122_cov_220_571368_g473_i0_p6_ORF_typecomplete_len128_score22_05Prefoldin_2/PF01920_20/1_5e05UPF0242/PF06785_11/0_00052DMPK_coil/PF08826_10/1_2DMPK_coil/PF08826_10/0_6HOOK/PF05622_12/0_015SlyX/PF04102_12/82SlyX/PF04102_12/0_2Spectrin/PF00435_21/0_028Sec2p/PF06428_11/38Sec2p/PF06428_11/0_71Myosin_tail_1/PF01576_19/0_046HAUS4/PF14735_6/0_37HAUS4/PF14735_6/5_7ABC
MGQEEDYTISLATQQALCEFAVLNWVKAELKSEIESTKKQMEETEDVLMEFDLSGSWLKVGESYRLINDTGAVMEELENRHTKLEETLQTYEHRLSDSTSESDRLKVQIEAVMGDRVRLTTGQSSAA